MVRSFSRVVFVLLLLATIAAGAWAYYYLKGVKKPDTSVLTFFPADAVCYLESNDVLELQSNIGERSMVTDDLRKVGIVGDFCRGIRMIDSLAGLSEKLREQLHNNDLHFAVYNDGKTWLLGFALKSLGDQAGIEEALRSILPKSSPAGDDLLRSVLNGETVYFHLIDGSVLASNSGDLVLPGAGTRLTESPEYSSFREQQPGSELLAFYINNGLYRRDRSTWPTLPLSNESGILAGVVDVRTSELRINGFSSGEGSALHSLMLAQRPCATEFLLAGLPAQTTRFTAYAADSVKFFLREQKTPGLQTFWQTVADSAMFDVRSGFVSNCTGYVCEFASGEELIVMTALRDTVLATEHLMWMSDSVYQAPAQFYRLRQNVKLFSDVSEASVQFVLMMGGRVYFSGSEKELISLSFALRTGQDLVSSSNTSRYFSQQVPTAFNYLLYCSPRRARKFAADAVGHAPETVFTNFTHFSFSLLQEKNRSRARMHLQYNPGETPGPSPDLLWLTHTDTTVSSKPELFRNHITGQNEIVVQDDAGALYLFSAKGERLWKKKIGSRIVSGLHIVDAFRNNKFQMLFNTADAIYLVDRNGDYVEGYPVKLRSQATSGISVFDYEKNRDYRILVSCADKRIYNFSAKGIPVADFQVPQTADRVHLPVQYANIGGSEFLVAVDSGGRIYTFSRRGQQKGTLQNRVTAGCEAFYTDAGSNLSESYIVYVDDRDHLLNKISFTDKKQIIKLPGDLTGAKCSFVKVDRNRFTDVLVAAGNRLFAFDMAGNKLAEHELPFITDRAGTFTGASNSVFYGFSLNGKQLAVVNSTRPGNLLTYQGTAPPLFSDLFRSGEPYFVLAEGMSLHCVKWRQ